MQMSSSVKLGIRTVQIRFATEIRRGLCAGRGSRESFNYARTYTDSSAVCVKRNFSLFLFFFSFVSFYSRWHAGSSIFRLSLEGKQATGIVG